MKNVVLIVALSVVIAGCGESKPRPPKHEFTQTEAEQVRRDKIIKKWIANGILESVKAGVFPEMNVRGAYLLTKVEDRRKVAIIAYTWAASPINQMPMTIRCDGKEIGTFSLEKGLSPPSLDAAP